MSNIWRQAENQRLAKKTRKILKKHPKAQVLHMRVYSTGEMMRATNLGWKMETNLSLGRGAGYQSYLMTAARADLDNALAVLVP